MGLYTDGSKLGQYRCGAGLSVWKTGENYGHKVELPVAGHDQYAFYLEDSEVPQAEMFGVLQSANWLIEHAQSENIKHAVVDVDSQGTIKGLDSHKIRSKLTLKTVQALNNAALREHLALGRVIFDIQVKKCNESGFLHIL